MIEDVLSPMQRIRLEALSQTNLSFQMDAMRGRLNRPLTDDDIIERAKVFAHFIIEGE